MSESVVMCSIALIFQVSVSSFYVDESGGWEGYGMIQSGVEIGKNV